MKFVDDDDDDESRAFSLQRTAAERTDRIAN